jgi:hypothetical protein
MHRPQFDYEIEDRTLGEDALEDDYLHGKYQKDFDAEMKSGIILACERPFGLEMDYPVGRLQDVQRLQEKVELL